MVKLFRARSLGEILGILYPLCLHFLQSPSRVSVSITRQVDVSVSSVEFRLMPNSTDKDYYLFCDKKVSTTFGLLCRMSDII